MWSDLGLPLVVLFMMHVTVLVVQQVMVMVIDSATNVVAVSRPQQESFLKMENQYPWLSCKSETELKQVLLFEQIVLVRAHLHPATATSLWHRSQISSIFLVLYCYTKHLWLRQWLILLLLGNRFVSHMGAMSQQCHRRITVAGCKWALNGHSDVKKNIFLP